MTVNPRNVSARPVEKSQQKARGNFGGETKNKNLISHKNSKNSLLTQRSIPCLIKKKPNQDKEQHFLGKNRLDGKTQVEQWNNPQKNLNSININFSKSLPRCSMSSNILSKLSLNRIPPSSTKEKDRMSNINNEFNPYLQPIENINISLFNPSAKSVKQYAYQEERNAGYRQTMEDFHKIVDKFMGDSSKGFFSIYDGHGGTEPVKYAKDRMPEIFSKFLTETNHNVEKSLIFSFQKLDDELKLFSEIQNVGSTATVVYITREPDAIFGSKWVAYCANVGDTRCALLSSTGCRSLSYNHKCTDENEVKRIKRAGGVVFNGRVFGQLILSRALGDFSFKKYGVISTPCINKHVIADKDQYIIICSDGVWDVVSDEEMAKMSTEVLNADQFAKKIVKFAKEKETRDNISCIVIKL